MTLLITGVTYKTKKLNTVQARLSGPSTKNFDRGPETKASTHARHDTCGLSRQDCHGGRAEIVIVGVPIV